MASIPLLLFKRGQRPNQELLAHLAAIVQQLTGEIGGEHELPQPAPGQGHVQTFLSNGGRVGAPEGDVPQALSDAIKRYFPESVWTDAARVSFIESAGWNAHAERNTLDRANGRCNVPIGAINGVPIVSEQSVGYYQINVCAHGHDQAYWRDVDNNVRYAAQLYAESGWRPWQFTARSLGLLE